MKSSVSIKFGILAAVAVMATIGVQAGPPFNNLEGVGGVAFNPLAYTAGQPVDTNGAAWYSKPQVGTWYVHLGDDNINWESFGIAETFGGRLELSYAYEAIRLGPQVPLAQPDDKNISKNNIGAKLLVIRENEGGVPYVPAVSVGSIWKTTDDNVLGNTAGFDYYAVATKLITQTPVPLLLSGGLLSSDEEVTGVLGHNREHDVTWFGNVDIIPVSCIATGFEYKQGSRFDNGVKNANYWDAHLAYFASPNLTLIGAYAYTGRDYTESQKIGLGGGFVLSAQYQF